MTITISGVYNITNKIIRYNAGKKQKYIADDIGISATTVCDTVNNTWKWVK